MESTRRRREAVRVVPWLPIKTTFRKQLPLCGQGVVSVNIKRRTTFAIRIRPALQPRNDNKMQNKDGYVEVEISTEEAILKAKRPCSEVELGPRTEPSGGLKEGKKVSYWFSFNRNSRVLKYGKGYIMEQTTLLTKSFPFPKTEQDPDPWEFIFRPDTPKEIVIKDVGGIEVLAMLDDPKQNKIFFSLSQVEMQDLTTREFRYLRQVEKMELQSLVDVEKKVSFYPHPLTYNWSPLVLDSSKATLNILSTNRFTTSASLPATCRELYENVGSAGVALEPRLCDAINYSINTEGKILNKKLKERQYLRVTVGSDRGSSPGIPYVLEIWPASSESPIHNHGNAFAVIKVLYGAIKVTIYNKTWDDEENQEVLMNFTAIQGDVTWISPNWFQTHKLKNESNKLFCATIQCYKYGQDDELMWPYFDYLEGKTVKEFLPHSDFEFTKMRERVLEEYRSDYPVSQL